MTVDSWLRELAAERDPSSATALTAVCCAHPLVLKAALRSGRREGVPVLVEATCNQVNHEGGYTGMRPQDFVERLHRLADEERFDVSSLVLGGDHLGPNPWRDRPAEVALAQAERMVAAYAAAGFTKFHLDASMRCADDPDTLDERVVAERAARLARVVEDTRRPAGAASPVYVIGTEVPPPGGAHHALDTVPPTDPAAASRTIETHREIFEAAGLGSAFERVIAVVVQPGVEFGDVNVYPYRPEPARALAAVLGDHPTLCFEAHSSDYQSAVSLERLARDGYRIQKVGPWLTFALREALYGLDLIAGVLDPDYSPGALPDAMEALMSAQPEHWQDHYAGSEAERRLARHYSYSDRIRYYWTLPEAEAAVERLFAALADRPIPETLVSQYLPGSWRAAMSDTLDAESLVLDQVQRALATYPIPRAIAD